jgi:hypothetical protein
VPELLPQSNSHHQADLVTAAQIEKGCPTATDVLALGHQVRARLKTVRGYEAKAREKAGVELRKAEDNWITVTQLLAEAKAKCTVGGFRAFKEKFCPNLGRSRIYELLQIASGKKTTEQVKAESRGRKAKQRAKNKREGKSSVTVTDKASASASKPEPLSGTVTESAEVEPRRAEHADLSPEEKAKAEYEVWLNAEDAAHKASAYYLEQFAIAGRAFLPKVTEPSHQYKARQLTDKLTEPPKAEEAKHGLGSVMENEWFETELVLKVFTSHTPAQAAKVVPSAKAPFIIEITDWFVALKAELTARSAENGVSADYSTPADCSIPHFLQRGTP